jgi:hypothetical protein
MKAKVSAVMWWVGPLAILGAVFAVISDQIGLVVHLPEVGEDAVGYYAVGSGLFPFVLVLLLVGMLGLYAHQPEGGAKVLEYGDPNVRYVLAELADEEPRTDTRQIPVQPRRAADGGAASRGPGGTAGGEEGVKWGRERT